MARLASRMNKAMTFRNYADVFELILTRTNRHIILSDTSWKMSTAYYNNSIMCEICQEIFYSWIDDTCRRIIIKHYYYFIVKIDCVITQPYQVLK